VKPPAQLLLQPGHASSRSEGDAVYISPVIFFFSSSTSLQQKRASDTWPDMCLYVWESSPDGGDTAEECEAVILFCVLRMCNGC
jgi:hypothetical protein